MKHKHEVYPYRSMKYYPRYAVFEISLLCNMRCKHCGSRAGKPRINELTTFECLDIAQQLIDMGLEYITLIGGEILLRPDWEKIARKFTDNGVTTTIITNAYKIDDQEIAQIKYANLNSVNISLDGLGETHNFIRNKKDAFDKILATFARFRNENIPFGVVTTILAKNFNDLEAMHALMQQEGAFAWQLQLASPMGNAADDKDFLITPEQLPTLIEFIKEKKLIGDIKINIGDNLCFKGYEDGRYFTSNTRPNWPGCMAGLLVVGIDSVGNVKGCESLYDDKFIEGNLRTNSLTEIWHKKDAFAYNRNYQPEMLRGKCSGCKHAIYCGGGCRQLSYFTSGCCHESIYCPNTAQLG